MHDAVSYSKDAFERQLTSTMVALNMPFAQVEHKEFRKLLQLIKPSIDFVGRKRARELVAKRCIEISGSILDDLGLNIKVFLALNCWTSPNSLSFIAVTGY